MNSNELNTALANKLQITKTEANKRMEDAISIITIELTKNKIVSLPNLGTFEVKKRNERISVNPASGKRVLIPPKLILKFKVANSLKEKIKALKP